MRALIVADSLALPRGDVNFEQTWPAMLAASLPAITWINRAQRLSTTERLCTEGDQGFDCLEFYRPDLVILQLGICDCAPRVLHRRMAMVLYNLPFGIGARFSAFLESWRGRKVSNCLVSPLSYEANLRAYLARASAHGTHVIAIPIATAGRQLMSKNPGVADQIIRYNRILDRLVLEFGCFKVVYPFDAVEQIDELLVDGYHLNEEGARAVVRELEPLVRKVIALRSASA